MKLTFRVKEYDPLEPQIAAELIVRAKQNQAATSQSQYNAPAQAFNPAQYGAAFAPPVQPPAQQAQHASAMAGFSAGAPNFTNLITSLDGASLQKLLGALQQQSPPTPQLQTPHLPQVPHQVPHAGAVPQDLASLLAGAGVGAVGAAGMARQAQTMPFSLPSHQQQQQPAQQQHQPPALSIPAIPAQGNPYAALAANPAFAANPALASLFANAAAAANATRPPQQQVQHQHQQHHHHHQQQQHQPAMTAATVAATPQMQNIMEQLAKWKQ